MRYEFWRTINAKINLIDSEAAGEHRYLLDSEIVNESHRPVNDKTREKEKQRTRTRESEKRAHTILQNHCGKLLNILPSRGLCNLCLANL